MLLWDEAERNLSARGWVHPERRHHARNGHNGCAPGDAEDCPECVANMRACEQYREALFAEIERLRQEHHGA